MLGSTTIGKIRANHNAYYNIEYCTAFVDIMLRFKCVFQSKSIHCTFTLRKEKFTPITLHDQTLPTVQSTFYKCIIIDHRLTWSHLRNKLLSLNYWFRHFRSLLTPSHIKLSIKLLVYKLYLKLMWTVSKYGVLQKSQTPNLLQHFRS